MDNLPLDARGLALRVISCVPGLAVVQLVYLALHRRRVAATVGLCVVLALHAILLLWHLLSRGPLDYSLLRENFGELGHPDALALVFGGQHLGAVLGVGAAVCVAVSLELGLRFFSRWRVGRFAGARAALALAALLLAGTLPAWSHDEVVTFARSAFNYYLPPPGSLDVPSLRRMGIDPEAQFPYFHAGPPSSFPPAPRPHVFVVAVESFNARFLGARTESGQALTPILDGQGARARRFERFYASSVQTARGHSALLCGVLPSFRLKEFTAYSSLRVRCLPELLRGLGYRTLYFSGQADLEFDRTGRAMERLGFDERIAMAGARIADVPADRRWGWGVQDDVLYTKALERLDEREREAPGGRDFVFLATISSHAFFDQIPAAQRYLYPSPRTPEQAYANALHLADRYLGALFDGIAARPYLRDAVVVITGDHGYPMGEHGSYHNEVGAFEDNFRTPLLLIAPGRIAPGVDRARASQIDLAPTILDLAGAPATENHFLGRSLLRPPADPPLPVFLSQPYDGKYLVVIDRDRKLTRQLQTGREQLYDLAADPGEHNDLAADPAHAAALERLRGELSLLYLNQRLLDANRIRPPDPR